MNTELFERYAEICKTVKSIEAQKKELQKEVLSHMAELDVDKVQSPFGTFSIGARKTYTYSEEVEIAKEEVKAIQKEEEENGTAKAKLTQYIRYQLTKE